MADMLVRLYSFEDEDLFIPRKQENGIIIKQACRGDKHLIIDFIKQNFNADIWPNECDKALNNDPVSCFVAVKNKELVGFACYDATTRGFFGPIGVKKEYRRLGIGGLLSKRTLFAMREIGYGYAVIGWVNPDAISFYEKCVNARIIEGSSNETSYFRNMISCE